MIPESNAVNLLALVDAGTAAGVGVGAGLLVAFAIVLLVNRSNSPDRLEDQPTSFIQEDDTRARNGVAAGTVIFALGFVSRFVISSPATVVGINLHPVGNVLMVIGCLSILAAIIVHLFSRHHA